QLARGDIEALVHAQRGFARRQLTWLRRMPGLRLIKRDGRSDSEVAGELAALLEGSDADP
ncbi:MAG: hypothetical protein H0W09_06540, partial [Solirubrobacterales bacterium]|nr:hypothetical protein [Solirubrobacterales bacterium]